MQTHLYNSQIYFKYDKICFFRRLKIYINSTHFCLYKCYLYTIGKLMITVIVIIKSINYNKSDNCNSNSKSSNNYNINNFFN